MHDAFCSCMRSISSPASSDVVVCFLDNQVEPAPAPPPLKSPWADVVRQHAKKEGAAGVTSPRAADAGKPAAPLERQAGRGRDTPNLPSYARPASGSSTRPEPSARPAPREAPHHQAPNAANGGRSLPSLKPAQPEAAPEPPSVPSVSPVAVEAATQSIPDADGTSTSSTDDKGTPRKEVSSLNWCRARCR
jgi:hypothetical protein